MVRDGLGSLARLFAAPRCQLKHEPACRGTLRAERSTNGGKSWSTLAQVGANVTTYSDSTVSPRKTYEYRVYAYNAAGNSPLSNVATITMPKGGSGWGGHGPAFGLAADASAPTFLPTLSGESFLLVPLAGNFSTATSAIDQTLAQWSAADSAAGRWLRHSESLASTS